MMQSPHLHVPHRNTPRNTSCVWLLQSLAHNLQAVPKRGEEPEHDALEKALLKTATRGVVRLFNAVSKAQRDQKDALVGGSRSRVSAFDLLVIGLKCSETLELHALTYQLVSHGLKLRWTYNPCTYLF